MKEPEKRTEKSRKRARTGFFLRALCFAVLTFAVLGYTAFVLIPKHDYGICSMLNSYRQPQGTVDVLTVGTSIAYAGINTNVLWEEYGIASYNLCSAEQPFWVSYYALKEALKTQRPRLILLDAKPAIYTQDYSRRGRIIMSTYGILSPDNRLGAIRACLEDPGKVKDYLMMFPVLHSEYKKVEAGSFAFPPDNGGRGADWKGYIEEDAVEQHSRPSLVWNSVRRAINGREETFARRIFELAREEGIPMLLICLPNPDYANDHMYMNYLFSVAEEYGVPGINFNHPDLRFGLRYSSCFADWQHLNVKGSLIFTRYLGDVLKQYYDLPDRRGDARYASYDTCAEKWAALYPSFESADPVGTPLGWFPETEGLAKEEQLP